MTPEKQRAEKFRTAIARLSEAFRESEDAVRQMEDERNYAVAALNPEPLPAADGATAITDEALRAEGFDWSDESAAFVMRIGRLSLWIRIKNGKGTWWLYFDSTYGGRVGSYRALQNIEELRAFVHLLGVVPRKQETANA